MKKTLKNCKTAFLIPIFSDISAALISRQSRVSVLASYAKINTRNRRLRQSTYLTTLSALVYPVSATTPHNFIPCHTPKPIWCDECNGLVYGLVHRGLRCEGCGIICHDRCRDLLNDDCLQKAAEKSALKKQKKASKKNNDKYINQNNTILEAIRKMMHDRIENHPKMFDMMREAFEIADLEHQDYMTRAQDKILSGSSQWKVTIKLTVHSAQGLYAKDKNGTSDPYVTIQIGQGVKAKKFKTKTVHKNLNPKWDESFSFVCQNSSDRIKVRVWDEDNDFKSALKAKFKRESDDFLGQTIMEVKMLSGEMDTWYNLDKRTEKSVVSGAIRLKTSVQQMMTDDLPTDNLLEDETQTNNNNSTINTLNNSGSNAPQPQSTYSYTEQYKCLHNIIFCYIMETSNIGIQGLGDMTKQNAKVTDFGPFFLNEAEGAVAEYALRYGVDPIFQALTHFSCLATKYRDPGMSQQMSLLLKEINEFFAKNRKRRNCAGSTDVPGVSGKSDSDDPNLQLGLSNNELNDGDLTKEDTTDSKMEPMAWLVHLNDGNP